MKHFYDAVEPKGAKIVGFTSTDGYDFEASEAVSMEINLWDLL